MPTIDELPPSFASADTDEILVSQNGVSRKVTRAQFLAGVQPQLAASTGSLVGRASAGLGEVQVLSIGKNLVLSGSTLSASASPYVISALPGGTVPQAADLVAVNQRGVDNSVQFSQFAAGLSLLSNVDASRLIVTPTGATAAIKLADFAANTIPKTGGQIQGPLFLAADPTGPTQASTKRYVDGQVSTRVSKAGDSISGQFTWGSSGNPNTMIQAGGASVFQWGYTASACNLVTQVAGSSPGLASPTSFHCLFESTHSGGTPARVIAGALCECSVSNDYSGPGGSLVDGPATNHWALGVTTVCDAVAAATAAGTAGSQHGGMYSQFIRTLPKGGYPTGKSGAEGWALWLVSNDLTGQPSSVSGATTGIEMDLAASGLDDAQGRYGIQCNLSASVQNSTGYCEYGCFIYVNGYNQPGNQSWFQSIMQLYAPYTVAAIDLSAGSQDIRNPITNAPNSAVAIKMRSGQKYGLNGDGLTGQYLVHNAQASQTELWSGGGLVVAFPDAGGMIVKSMPVSSAGLPSGSLWSNNGAVTRVS